MTADDPPNGSRVTTRDLLSAVEGMEGRVTARMDRLERQVATRLDGHGQRLQALERDAHADDVRAETYGRIAGGARALLAAAIALGSFGLGVLGALAASG